MIPLKAHTLSFMANALYKSLLQSLIYAGAILVLKQWLGWQGVTAAATAVNMVNLCKI